ncbi:PE family protein, partial [Mycobacterium szulgai]|uniref:PE family protein n=2 Tax=Mycobacterium szulgai TaxID=1787 RepID=UPI0021F2C339
MSFLTVAPEWVVQAAGDVAAVGRSLDEARAAAAASTTVVAAAGNDEISVAVAALFGTHGRQYQELSEQMAAFHERFAQSLAVGAKAYASAEAVAATPLQTLERDVLAVINAPTQLLLGRPLIGNGANGTLPGQAGGAGGLLIGNGGNGAGGGFAGVAGGAGGAAGLLGAG